MKVLSKKIVSLSLLMIILVSMLAGCGMQKQVDTSVSDVQSRGVLRVAVPDYDTSLLYYNSSVQAYRGLEAEVIDVIAQGLGVSVEYIPCTREQMYNSISLGSADLAIGYIDENSSNASSYARTISYGGENLYIVSPRGVYAGNLNVFEKKVVGVSSLIDSAAYGALYVSGVENVMIYNSTASISEALLNNSIAGYLCYRSEGEVLTSSGDFQIQSSKELSREYFVAIALPTYYGLINSCNDSINGYLEGEILPTWIQEEQNKQEQQDEIDNNSLFN